MAVSLSFRQSLGLQRLDDHKAFLKIKGFDKLENRADEKRKLHDLYYPPKQTWVECKTDQSKFVGRMLIEAKSNFPISFIRGVQRQRPFPYSELLEIVQAIPEKFNALLFDKKNREPRHVLSYLWTQPKKHKAFDLSELFPRIDQIKEGLDWIVFESPEETGNRWGTIALIVPVGEVDDWQLPELL